MVTTKQRTKLQQLITYIGLFSGVGLLTHSLVDPPSTFIYGLIGLIIAPLSLLIDRHRSSSEPLPLTKLYLSYLTSTAGVALFLSSWIVLPQDNSQFMTYMYISLILSYFARYNTVKFSALGIIEDYAMYILAYAGVTISLYGIFNLTTDVMKAVTLILVGLLLTPTTLILRENALLKTKEGIRLRKFLPMLVITTGLVCNVYGILTIFHEGWLSSLALLVGVVILIGGTVFSEDGDLATLRDLL